MWELGIKDAHRLSGLAMVARNAGWWWPFEGAVILTDRPQSLHRDAQGRLHCEDGPAIAYRDGFTVYAWHGVRVPIDLIEGDGWSTDRILQERNAEIRRCAVEKIGWDTFITQAGLERVGEPVPDPGNPGHQLALYDAPQIFAEPVRVLLCTNATPERDGTRRRFGLTVPAEISDPIDAAAWTFDVDPAVYAGLVRAS